MPRFIDLTGQRFGNLLVLSRNGSKIYKTDKGTTHCVLWRCKCDCGNEKDVTSSKLKGGTTVSCGCHKAKNILPKIGSNHHGWTGYKDISGSYFTQIQNSAKIRKKDFSITIEYIWEIYEKQNKKCAISGVDIYFNPLNSERRIGGQTASVDRINPKLGYIEGNIQIVHKEINYMKHKLTNEELINWSKIIANHHG